MSTPTTRPYRAAVCTVTPYDEAGRLDDAAVAHLVETIVSQGVSLAIGTASPGDQPPDMENGGCSEREVPS